MKLTVRNLVMVIVLVGLGLLSRLVSFVTKLNVLEQDIIKAGFTAPDTAGIPVIALTAQAMAGDREKALAAG